LTHIIEETKATVAIERCATCSAACPVRTDTRAYVDLIQQGRYLEAFEKIREFNPFPSVCSLICHHPCEQECRRATVDAAVALRNLKRFAVEQALEYRQRKRQKAVITSSKTVGVIGAGPAGLTVAHDCIKAGYAVTVYEAMPRIGGILACAIPRYRLPDEVLQQDLDDILALGVEVRTNVRVGKDIHLSELRERHDAVVLALGLSESRTVPIENGDHPDVVLALPFLRASVLGPPPKVHEHVLVVGGGNVAVDCARTAIRLGARTVKMIMLENEEEMPAWDWECREALEEGITFVHRQGPKRLLTERGKITGLVTRAVLRVFDESGRFAPTYDDQRLTTIPGEMVIIAIGQRSDLSLVQGTPVQLDERGPLRFDRETMATSMPGVFACGEVVTGPGAAIEAVASGHRAARAVLHYLQTGAVTPVCEEPAPEKVGELPKDVIEHIKRMERIAMPTLSPEERRRSFVQFELGYTEKMALAEARRCLSCTAGATVDEKKCEACLTCLRVCPFGVPQVDKVAVMCSEMCQACGLCAVECPARAISIRRFAPGDIRDRVTTLLRGAPAPLARVEFTCAQDAETNEDLRDRIITADGVHVAVLPVTCAARVDEIDMMKPFELGARAVVVRRCRDCRYRGAMDRLSKRIGRTREILTAAGIGADKLTLE